MDRPKLSIIVPVYRVEKYLARCLHSLRNQTLRDIEIILVDDASPDKSPALCDAAAREDKRIKVIHKKNEGAGLARNAGLAQASGTYIGFVDADDYTDVHMFEKLYNAAEKYNADLVLSGVCFVDGTMFSDEGSCVRKSYFTENTCFTAPEDLRMLQLGIVGAMPGESEDSRYGMSVWKNLFRRDIIQNNQLQFVSEREMLSEDALFMLDYIGCARSAVGIPDTLYYYCRNEYSISKSYKADRLDKGLVFLREAEKRLQQTDSPHCRLYLDRFWQAFCRVLCTQEILYAAATNTPHRNLRDRLISVCTHEVSVRVLQSYPIGKLPLRQAVFAFAMRHRLYWLQTLIVKLRNR